MPKDKRKKGAGAGAGAAGKAKKAKKKDQFEPEIVKDADAKMTHGCISFEHCSS